MTTDEEDIRLPYQPLSDDVLDQIRAILRENLKRIPSAIEEPLAWQTAMDVALRAIAGRDPSLIDYAIQLLEFAKENAPVA